MTLTPGSHLGPYEVLHQLGAGGMGEVYRARDPRLGRDVALKVLPATLAADPGRQRRFELEARAVGRLNHPNILHVYDVGQADGQPFLITEILEGDTLRERLAAGALPVRKAVEIAIAIAHGLAAAHDHGIVHRDLKPQNLLVTRDGQLKILDFGLAKLAQPDDEDHTGVTASTISYDASQGEIWGTVGYMSPEQVRGKTLDHRSDIFSFGAILYEMLAGKRSFQGDSPADTMSAILHEDPPDLNVSNKNVPTALERIVRHCLEKSPEERFRSAHDLAFQLDGISGQTGPGPPRGSAMHSATSPSGRGATFRQITHRRGIVYSARFAPDGDTILYSAAWEGRPIETFMKRPEATDALPLPFPPAQLLAISPRGEVASLLNPKFVHNGVWLGTLAASPLFGGAPREIAEGIQHADFARQGGGLVVTRDVDGKGQLEYPPGHVLYRTQGHISFPRFSPAGDRIAFFEHPWPLDDRGSVAIVTLEGTKSTISSEWATVQGLAWSPDGEEIWFAAAPVGTARALYAIKLSGELRPISGFPGSARLLDVSPEGRMLVCRDGTRVGIYAKPPGETKERELSWLDWSLLADLSPDGRMILFDEENEEAGPNYVACIRKTDGSPVVQLGEGAARLLSPDGRWALCRLPVPGSPLTLYPTGAGQKREIEAGGRKIAPGREVRWLPDGRRILQFGRTEDGAPTAWLLDLEKVEWVPLLPDWTDLPSGVAVAPDGLRGVASFKDRTTSIFSFEEGSMKSGPMLEPDERVVTISSDGEWIYVCSSQRRVPCPTHRLHLLTGRREAWREIGPEDLVGVMSINLRITPDGEAYAYTYSRVLSELYLAEGLA